MSDRILRLQHVEVRVPDLELCTAYYTEVLGLIETAHEERPGLPEVLGRARAPLGRPAPGADLRPGPHVLQGRRADDLDHYTDGSRRRASPVKRYATGELGPGWGEAIRFEAPTGHIVELVHGMEKVGNMLPLTNPPPRPRNLVGIAPPRLDHMLHHGRGRRRRDPRSSATCWSSGSPSRSSPTTGTSSPPGWSAPTRPHDIALVTGPNGGAAPLRVLARRLERRPRRRRHAAPTTA